MALDAGLMAVVDTGLMTVGAGLAVGAGLDTAVGGGVGITEIKNAHILPCRVHDGKLARSRVGIVHERTVVKKPSLCKSTRRHKYRHFTRVHYDTALERKRGKCFVCADCCSLITSL